MKKKKTNELLYVSIIGLLEVNSTAGTAMVVVEAALVAVTVAEAATIL